jgi:hypothetical protein
MTITALAFDFQAGIAHYLGNYGFLIIPQLADTPRLTAVQCWNRAFLQEGGKAL